MGQLAPRTNLCEARNLRNEFESRGYQIKGAYRRVALRKFDPA